ncbi:collectin-11 [Plakobranchus ocellatus]|uniref:Collectin-11 n=1 Tax=Plakobranchus ocellatus TaxID=259542 RepID=A0AAV4AYZ6_9GAST|nr:collectin-11 [Plakobranchus ocellatus]
MMYDPIIFITILVCVFPSRAVTKADASQQNTINVDTKHFKIYEGKCFEFFTDPKSKKQYFEAQDECEKNQGFLAMPKTKKINQFLVDNLLELGIREDVFIGLNDMREEGKFRWEDGNTLVVPGFYENFAKGGVNLLHRSPESRDCVTLNPVTNIWLDIDCRRNWLQRMFGHAKRRLFICEYKNYKRTNAFCTTDATVAVGNGFINDEDDDYKRYTIPFNNNGKGDEDKDDVQSLFWENNFWWHWLVNNLKKRRIPAFEAQGTDEPLTIILKSLALSLPEVIKMAGLLAIAT